MLKRKIYGIVMLSVILPTILLSSFHHHHLVAEGHCFNCSHHVPHSHLGGVSQTDECLVCQFLALVWAPSSVAIPDAPVVVSKLEFSSGDTSCVAAKLISIPPRAPPVVFC